MFPRTETWHPESRLPAAGVGVVAGAEAGGEICWTGGGGAFVSAALSAARMSACIFGQSSSATLEEHSPASPGGDFNGGGRGGRGGCGPGREYTSCWGAYPASIIHKCTRAGRPWRSRARCLCRENAIALLSGGDQIIRLDPFSRGSYSLLRRRSSDRACRGSDRPR